jgi:hypothetical protein
MCIRLCAVCATYVPVSDGHHPCRVFAPWPQLPRTCRVHTHMFPIECIRVYVPYRVRTRMHRRMRHVTHAGERAPLHAGAIPEQRRLPTQKKGSLRCSEVVTKGYEISKRRRCRDNPQASDAGRRCRHGSRPHTVLVRIQSEAIGNKRAEGKVGRDVLSAINLQLTSCRSRSPHASPRQR